MKLDRTYTSIDICPKTGEHIYDTHGYDGVCPYCGHKDFLIVHHNQIVGRWNRPSFVERIFQGKKAEFLRKDEEDKVWRTLKND